MSLIKENPPISVVSNEEYQTYCTLHDDITENGGTLKYEDRHALGELAASLVDMAICRKEIRAGTTSEVQGDRNTVTKPKPEVAMLQKLQVHVKAMFREFNLTPNSRGVKGTPGGGLKDDGFGEI